MRVHTSDIDQGHQGKEHIAPSHFDTVHRTDGAWGVLWKVPARPSRCHDHSSPWLAIEPTAWKLRNYELN